MAVNSKGAYTLRLQRIERASALELSQEERWWKEVAALNQQGFNLYRTGQYAEAAAVGEKVLAPCEKLYPKSQFSRGHPDLAMSLNNLGGACTNS